MRRAQLFSTSAAAALLVLRWCTARHQTDRPQMRVCTFTQQEPEQFVPFELERICFLDVCVVHALTAVPLPGVKLKAYDVTAQRVASNGDAKGVRDSSSSSPKTRCVQLCLP